MSLPGRETHIETLGTVVQEEIVVTCLGMATHGWNRICPKPSNFHLADSMGQAIPLAAGLALAGARSRIIVMEGDGGPFDESGLPGHGRRSGAGQSPDPPVRQPGVRGVGQPAASRTHGGFHRPRRGRRDPHCATIERAENFRPALEAGLGRKAFTFLTLKIRPNPI